MEEPTVSPYMGEPKVENEIVSGEEAKAYFDKYQAFSNEQGYDLIVAPLLVVDDKPIEDKEKSERVFKLINAVLAIEGCAFKFNNFTVIKKKV